MDKYLRQSSESTGGGCYSYMGQLLDGYYVGASDWGTGYIVDTNPFEVDDDVLWHNEWFDKHVVRELTKDEWKLILRCCGDVDYE